MYQQIEKIQQIFIERKMTLAVAESLTGGNIQALLTAISGSSAYFSGGVTAYNLRQKVDILGVDEENAKACNCVSAQTAEEMAKGISTLMNTDFGVATTGYVSPTIEIETAYAYISVYRRSDNSFVTFKAENKKYVARPTSQTYFAKNALQALIDRLEE